jgi:hypothetical protein
MLPTDGRLQWTITSRLVSDPRVVHFWDQDKVMGRWFATQAGNEGGIIWDAYFFYGPQASWVQGPQPLVDAGGTVFGERERLQQHVIPLLQP